METGRVNNMDCSFGNYFEEMRKRSGYETQKDLSEKSGISKATISRIELGKQVPNVKTLQTLSKFLVSTTLNDLLVRTGQISNPQEVNIDWKLECQRLQEEADIWRRKAEKFDKDLAECKKTLNTIQELLNNLNKR